MTDDIEDPEIEDMLVQADQIARQRGYFGLPQSELLKMAEEACEAHYNAAGLTHRIATVMGDDEIPKIGRDPIDAAEVASEEQSEGWLKYLATTVALDTEARKKHTAAMIEKYGPGFLVGA